MSCVVKNSVAVGVCLVLFLGGQIDASGSGEGDSLVVLTFNVRSGRGSAVTAQYKTAHMDSLVALIDQINPDIVLIQELDRGVRRSDRIDQFAYIADATGFSGRFAHTVDYQGGQYGIALFTPRELLDYQYVELPQLSGKEPRALQIATIETAGGQRVHVMNAHIDAEPHARGEQIRMVLEYGAGLASGPAVLAGDFNALPGTAALGLLTETWQDVALLAHNQPPATYPATAPRHRLDYIFFKGAALELTGVEYPDNHGISDHLPVVARFEVRR
jgi:endonuclease/exonuclease/phosphatase family metal-dependent hydrolase